MSDFGDGKWVLGRKDYRCEACGAKIPKAESHYHYKGVFYGEWQDWRMHRECYESFVKDDCEEFVTGDFVVPARIRSAV